MTELINTKLNESEITCILDAIKNYIQVIADELSDDYKYKDIRNSIEYKAKSETLRFLKEIQDKLLHQQELLASKVLERCNNISPQTSLLCELPIGHLLWKNDKGFYHRNGNIVWRQKNES